MIRPGAIDCSILLLLEEDGGAAALPPQPYGKDAQLEGKSAEHATFALPQPQKQQLSCGSVWSSFISDEDPHLFV